MSPQVLPYNHKVKGEFFLFFKLKMVLTLVTLQFNEF